MGSRVLPYPKLKLTAARRLRERRRDIQRLFEALGGIADVALITGVGLTAPYNWRRNGAIPKQHFISIEAAAKRRRLGDVPTHIFGDATRASRGDRRSAA